VKRKKVFRSADAAEAAMAERRAVKIRRGYAP
jgi:hypothetical protein